MLTNSFQARHFVAKLSSGKFNSVWLDYIIKTTENKALKGSGGIIGLTLKGSALDRWFMARPTTAQYAFKYKENVLSSKGMDKGSEGIGKAAEKRCESDVRKLCEIFDSSFIDPFDLTDALAHLVNIATGAVASPDLQQSMVDALDTGATMLSKFVKERLVEPDHGEYRQRKSLYDSRPRSNEP